MQNGGRPGNEAKVIAYKCNVDVTKDPRVLPYFPILNFKSL